MSGLIKDMGVVKVSPEWMSSSNSLRMAFLGPHTPTMYAKFCLITCNVCRILCVSYTHKACRIVCVCFTHLQGMHNSTCGLKHII